MKYNSPLLLLLALPMFAIAQPEVKNAEDFKIGTILKFQSCDTAGITAGNSGANQTWDFSKLKQKEDTITEWMVSPSETPYKDKFPTANQVEKYSDGSYGYVDKEKDHSLLVGFTSKSMTINYPKPMMFAKRPISFKNHFSDTYRDNFSISNMDFSGAGTVNIVADGYGKLILPNKTYNNVLRIKITQLQTDTIKEYKSLNKISIITYAWFGEVQTSALFKINYTKSAGFNSKEVGYLLSETTK